MWQVIAQIETNIKHFKRIELCNSIAISKQRRTQFGPTSIGPSPTESSWNFTRIFPAGHRAHTVYVGVHVPGGRRHSQRRRKHHHSGPGGGGGGGGGGGSIGGSGSVGGGAGKDNVSEKQQEVERPGASGVSHYCSLGFPCADIIAMWWLRSVECQ